MEDIGYPCWHPSGVQSLSRSYPGGIAHCRELNHRLMALNPPGSLLTVVPKDPHPLALAMVRGVKYDCVNADKLKGEERLQVLQALGRINLGCSFPTITIKNRTIVGFRRDQIEEALQI